MRERELEAILFGLESLIKAKMIKAREAGLLKRAEVYEEVYKLICERTRQIKIEKEREYRRNKEAEREAQKHIYNTRCKHYCEVDGEKCCDIQMDMQFCSLNCAFATWRGRVEKWD